ncbi:MAG: hypothetical protein IJR69_09815 [Bacteroidaceae bacterium]|nr:hypothetical protein [Bacteroidaceae bacterium]
MKGKKIIASLLLITGMQTGWAQQKVVLHLSNNEKVEYNVLQVDSITFTEKNSMLRNTIWDFIEDYPLVSELKNYIITKNPSLLFYNKDYVPAKGGETWDMYLKCLNAQINETYPTYTMVMPTNEAWAKAKEMLEPLYIYPNRYEDKVMGDQGYAYIRNINNPDSLANLSMEMDIISPLVFKDDEQPADGSYLLTTHGDTLRSTATWDKNSIFNGWKERMSKSTCCVVPEWAYPREMYNPDFEVEIGDGSFYYKNNTSSYYKVGPETKAVRFNNSLFSGITDKYGRVGGDDFYYLAAPNPTANPHVEIKLEGGVTSGKYDIYVVMVPYWYKIIAEDGLSEDFLDQHYIDSISAMTKMSFITRIRYNNNAENGKDVLSQKSQTFEYDGTKVDTILVAEDFEFPYSYKNLRYSYPTLLIEGATRAAAAKNGFMYFLCIDRVILKRK